MDISHDENIAHRLLAAEPALLTSRDFGPCVHQGAGSGRSLIIGDQAEIPLYPDTPRALLDYRMACLAKSGDIVVVRQRDPVFESYLLDTLGLSDITFLEATGPDPATRQALLWGVLGDRLGMMAHEAEDLTLKSYLTTGNTWRLARYLGEAAQADIHVSGPSPRLTRRINDKLWFGNLARRIIGQDATPPSMSAYGPAAAAGLLAYLAKRAPHVVVKVPDSAGSTGNLTFESADLLRMRLRDIRDQLVWRLRGRGWQGRYPVLIGVWDENVTCSPSVQLWIPLLHQGSPVAEGVFEQRVQGPEGAFVGAAKSTLPKRLQVQLMDEASRIAIIAQKIGYFGRCSMDAVICQPPGATPQIHWIECNGRWGGVSIPMTLAKRIGHGHLPNGLLILQDAHDELPALDTGRYLSALDDLLWRKGALEGVIVLSPPYSEHGLSVNLLIIAQSQSAAQALATQALSRLQNCADDKEGNHV